VKKGRIAIRRGGFDLPSTKGTVQAKKADRPHEDARMPKRDKCKS
jgi:hypothetical protein